MSEKFPLHDLLSPMNREERLKVQENWMRITAYLNSLQTQILMLAGGKEIDELLERINEAIESSETTAVEVNTLLEQMNSVLTEMETATSNSVETRDQLIVLKNDLETLQTSLNTAINREAERVSNENTRVSNENDRINTENEREADEQNRISAENARIDNELSRINAENSRVSEENIRVTNENARQDSHEQLLELLQNMKSEEYDATKTYNFPNFVTRNGETFIALKSVTGIIPVDDGINYRLFAKKGLDGQGSVSSVNGELPDANGNVQIEISNQTEILDLLTSQRTDAALSAKQGKFLNDNKVNTSDKATTAQAQAGTNDTRWMTPLKTWDAIIALFTSIVATQADAVGGTAEDRIMTPLRVNDVTGKLSALQTTNKTNIVQAVNEVKTEVTQHLEQINEHKKDYLAHGITGTAAGSANTYTLTPTVPLMEYQKGLRVTLFVNVANTAASTLNISDKGAVDLKKNDGSDFGEGELVPDTPYTFVHNGTAFLASSGGGGGETLIEYEEFYENMTGITKIATDAVLSVSKRGVGSATINRRAVFAGGATTTTSTPANAGVDSFNYDLVRTVLTPLSVARRYPEGIDIGNYALFAGGNDGTSPVTTVDAYNADLTKVTVPQLTGLKFQHSVAKIGGIAIFAGGQVVVGSSYSNTCEGYNENLVKVTVPNLSVARYELEGAHVGNYAIFAGGRINTAYYDTVDTYSATLVKGIAPALSRARMALFGGNIGNYALFAGGFAGGTVNEMDAYNTNLSKATPGSLPRNIETAAVARTPESLVFAGGLDGSAPVNAVLRFNKSLTRSGETNLTEARSQPTGASIGEKMLFTGGVNSNSGTLSAIEAYKENYNFKIPVTAGSKYKLNSANEVTAPSNMSLTFSTLVNGYVKMKTGKVKGGI